MSTRDRPTKERKVVTKRVGERCECGNAKEQRTSREPRWHCAGCGALVREPTPSAEAPPSKNVRQEAADALEEMLSDEGESPRLLALSALLSAYDASLASPRIETCGDCPVYGEEADEHGNDVPVCTHHAWSGPPHFCERPIEQTSPPPGWCPLRKRKG